MLLLCMYVCVCVCASVYVCVAVVVVVVCVVVVCVFVVVVGPKQWGLVLDLVFWMNDGFALFGKVDKEMCSRSPLTVPHF